MKSVALQDEYRTKMAQAATAINWLIQRTRAGSLRVALEQAGKHADHAEGKIAAMTSAELEQELA